MRMTKTCHLLAWLLLPGTVSSVVFDAGGAGADERSNVIVIVSDDSGYNEFSLNGSKLFPTPQIDSIAADGVRFSQGYTSGTVCSPTRAGLMTGRYQNRFGHEFNIPPVYSEENGLSLDETTLPEVLQAAGYRTIAIGKWHLGYAPQFHPLSRGFTDYYGFLQGARSYFPLEKPTVLNRLLRNREPVEETFEYMTDELGRAAAEYIEDRGDRPFFMYLAFNATHGPNHATEADLEAVRGGGGNENHRAMTRSLDRAVGVVLDALEKEGIADNTMVIFINDNGGVRSHDNTPLKGFKGSTWEGGIKVPFVMKWPKQIQGGQVFDHPVISLDIFPTVLAAAQVEAKLEKPLDGVNLVPFVTGKDSQRPHPTLFWKNGGKWAVRDGDLKLVAGNAPVMTRGNRNRQNQARDDQDQIGLFNVVDDPSESKNLLSDNPQQVAKMKSMYEEWKKDFPKTPWKN
jgi:arylsulfatase A-like enzyme